MNAHLRAAAIALALAAAAPAFAQPGSPRPTAPPTGQAVLSCHMGANGAPTGCQVLAESPTGQGVGAAALALVAMSPATCGPVAEDSASFLLKLDLHGPGAPPTPDVTRPGWFVAAPQWSAKPSAAELTDDYPDQATRQHVDGHATLQCVATADGHLAGCRLMEETPVGMSFGAALLKMSPLFALKPETCGGQFAGATVVLPFTFLIDPSAPAIADLAPDDALLAFYPEAARASGVSGEVVLTCGRTPHGGFSGCQVTSETPAGHGFGAAALALTSKAIECPAQTLSDQVAAPQTYRFRFSAAPLGIAPDVLREGWMVDNPAWLRRPSGEEIAAVYPGGYDGRAAMSCVVDAAGGMTHCRVASETPAGGGFGKAALSLAHYFRLAAVTPCGASTVGTRVMIPVAWRTPGG